MLVHFLFNGEGCFEPFRSPLSPDSLNFLAAPEWKRSLSDQWDFRGPEEVTQRDWGVFQPFKRNGSFHSKIPKSRDKPNIPKAVILLMRNGMAWPISETLL